MSRQHKSCAFSVYAEKLLERQRVRNRCLAGKGAAHIGRGLPIHQAAIPQQRDPGTVWTGRAQGHELELSQSKRPVLSQSKHCPGG
jgi:hypothetical protein